MAYENLQNLLSESIPYVVGKIPYVGKSVEKYFTYVGEKLAYAIDSLEFSIKEDDWKTPYRLNIDGLKHTERNIYRGESYGLTQYFEKRGIFSFLYNVSLPAPVVFLGNLIISPIDKVVYLIDVAR